MKHGRMWSLVMSVLLTGSAFAGMLVPNARALAQEIPAGYECETQPAGLLDVLGMLNDVGDAQYSNRVQTVDRTDFRIGDPLTAEDTDAVNWTVRQVVACANSLDPLRVLPLLSKNFQAALVANIANVGDLSGVLDQLPFVASDTVENGGAPALTVEQAWYDADSTKRIWAEVTLPVQTESGASKSASFLVSFVYDEYFWVIDAVWTIS